MHILTEFLYFFFTYRLTPLHLAIKSGNSEIIDLLLHRNDILVNVQTKIDIWFFFVVHGNSPLHLACKLNFVEAVQKMLQHKFIDCYAVTSNGLTADKLTQDPNLLHLFELYGSI